MAQPNCFIVNHYDYHLKHVKVRLKSAGDPGVFGVANRNSLDLVMKGRDTPECLIRYNTMLYNKSISPVVVPITVLICRTPAHPSMRITLFSILILPARNQFWLTSILVIVTR